MSSVRSGSHRMSRRRMVGGITLGGAGGILLAACGGGGGDGQAGPASTGNSSPAAGAGTATAQKQPVKGGTLKFTINGDPPNFDLHANSTYLVNNSIAPVYNQLVRFDPAVAEEPPEAIIGDLAKTWEQSSDGLRYTFKLNEGVSFHDGKAFTAEDVKASLERMMNPPQNVVSPRKASLAVIDKIETPDPLTVVLAMKRPAPSLLSILAQGWMAMYSAQDIAGNFEFKLKTNGTGPFKFKEYARGNRLDLVANPAYFVPGIPYLDGISVFIQVDQGAMVSSFQSGQTNFCTRFTESNVESLEAAVGNKITVDRRNGYGFNSLNFGHQAPWRDPRVQRAVSLAMDRQESIDLLYEGKGFLGGYMPGGGGWAVNENELRSIPGYQDYSEKSVAEAKQLLQAAGLRPGHQTTILTRRGQGSENLSVFIKAQLDKVGIDAKPQVLEDAAAYDALNNRAYDLAPWAHAIALDDPDAVFAEFYLTNSPRNYSGIGSPEVDALFAKQSETLNLAERKKLVKEMQQKGVPLHGKVILAWSTRRVARWNMVQGYTAHVGPYNNSFHRETWLERG